MDNDYSSFDRNLQMVNASTFSNISSLEITSGTSAWVWFKIIGDPTWYDANSKINYEFTYDNVWYNGSASYNFGAYYSRK